MDTDHDPHDDVALIDKLRKLLAMAEGAANDHEADAFSRKAAELIARHRVDPARLVEVDTAELTVEEYGLGRGAYVRGRLALLQVIAEAHDCQVVFEQRRDGTVALVAGYRGDLSIVGVMYQSLHAQAAGRMAAQRRATGAATQQWRRSFLFGYADQVRQLLTATRTESECGAHSRTVLPALRARQQRVSEYANQQFGRVRAARRPSAATKVGFTAGQQAAREADLGRGRVGGRLALDR